MKKNSLALPVLACVLFFLPLKGAGQSGSLEWFPDSPLFPLLEYDLLECQAYSGIFVLEAEQKTEPSSYIPVNLGLLKPLFQWGRKEWKMGAALGAASYTQFEIERYDERTLRGGLLNSDFKASGFLYAQKGRSHFRFQVFHISSHLGDDYMIRNQDFSRNDKSVSYEQIDLIYLHQLENLGLYLGLGEVFSPHAFRKRFMIEGGFQGSLALGAQHQLVYGSDLKIYAENDYEPDIHAGLGILFKANSKAHLRINLDGFYGELPYSTLDYGKVFWGGLSCRITP